MVKGSGRARRAVDGKIRVGHFRRAGNRREQESIFCFWELQAVVVAEWNSLTLCVEMASRVGLRPGL